MIELEEEIFLNIREMETCLGYITTEKNRLSSSAFLPVLPPILPLLTTPFFFSCNLFLLLYATCFSLKPFFLFTSNLPLAHSSYYSASPVSPL